MKNKWLIVVAGIGVLAGAAFLMMKKKIVAQCINDADFQGAVYVAKAKRGVSAKTNNLEDLLAKYDEIILVGGPINNTILVRLIDEGVFPRRYPETMNKEGCMVAEKATYRGKEVWSVWGYTLQDTITACKQFAPSQQPFLVGG